jgi:hypothetical protein
MQTISLTGDEAFKVTNKKFCHPASLLLVGIVRHLVPQLLLTAAQTGLAVFCETASKIRLFMARIYIL